MKQQYVIGIDPGSVVTGLAVWDRQVKGISCLIAQNSHCAAIFWVLKRSQELGKENILLRIEDARRVRHLPSHVTAGLNRGGNRDQGVGYVKALSKDWEAFAKLQGFQYELVSPHSNQTKTTPEYFKSLTGIETKKTQHHLRDAAMLVVGL